MATTCLLHNNRTCGKKQTIESAKSDRRIRIVYGYDWNAQSGNRDSIRDEVMRVADEVKEDFPLRFSFENLRGKDGSIYCDICRQIRSADVALFDISTHNPNVILELGLAIGAGAYVFILRSTQFPASAHAISDLDGILEYRFYRRGGQLTFQADFRRSLKSKLRLVAKNRQSKNADELNS